MKKIIYDATTPESRAATHPKVGKWLQEQKDGFEYIIMIKRNKPVRSAKQNAIFHLILTVYANAAGLYLDEIKHDFYDAIGFFYFHMDHDGVERKRYKSSADCDSAEMNQLIDQVQQWGAVNYPEAKMPANPRDTTYAEWIEVENEYERATAGW